jgi:hypothetical protein
MVHRQVSHPQGDTDEQRIISETLVGIHGKDHQSKNFRTDYIPSPVYMVIPTTSLRGSKYYVTIWKCGNDKKSLFAVLNG